MYVAETLEMLASGARIKASGPSTSYGCLNLTRVLSPAGYVIDAMPEPPPLFHLIQRRGKISTAEMFRVFNMGIGFCFVVAPEDADTVIAIAERHGRQAHRIGHATRDPQQEV